MRRVALVRSTSPHCIGMEVPRGGSSCASCKFLVGRRDCSLALWANAPLYKGGGGGDTYLPRPANRWCCDGYEPATLALMSRRRNPLQSKVFAKPVFGIDPTYLEVGAAAVGVVAVGGLIYWIASRPTLAQQQAQGTVYMGPGGSNTPLPPATSTGPTSVPGGAQVSAGA